jgi:glycosyltransferase involved in cell wall biosynthesis
MKRILHISKFYTPVEGGIERICKNVIDCLPEYEHQVVCFNLTNTSLTDVVDGIKVRRVGCFNKIASQPMSFSYYGELKKMLAEFKPDLIHFHAPNPLIMIYLLWLIPKDCKLIVHWHSDIVEQKRLYHLVKPFEKRLLRRADRVLTTSPLYIEDSKPLQQVSHKVVIIPCSIEPEKFDLKATELGRLQRIKDQYAEKPVVLFVGRHVAYKGLNYLLEAEKYIQSDCVILIGGDGPLFNKLKNGNLSERIRFLGRIPDQNLKLYYHVADVFAFPSVSKNEAFGVSLAEAMYCGTPAITFTIKGSGVNWVNLNGVTGLEVENGNALRLAQAIDQLLMNKAMRELLGKNARQRVLDLFVMDRIQSQLQSLYMEAFSCSNV